jgi:putative transposase
MAERRPPELSDDCCRGFGRYFLTICTAHRRQYFTSEEALEPAKSALLRAPSDYRVEVSAYCFMKDHFHGLFESLALDCEFTKFVGMFKQGTAFQHKRSSGQKLWQEGYFDRVLRRDESTLDVIAYILANPVRAGLCAEPRDYPFSGSSVYSVGELCDAIAGRPSVEWRP